MGCDQSLERNRESTTMTDYSIPYTAEESVCANREWRATCGHHSIAAAVGVKLDAVKAACPKLTGWMSPTMISKTLAALGCNPRAYPCAQKMGQPPPWMVAIMRIQWEGPWLKEGVPVKAAYAYTHYIAVTPGSEVMDPALDTISLLPWQSWISAVNEYAPQTHKRAYGWHFTHAWTPHHWDDPA